MPSIPDLMKLLEKEPGDPFVLYALAQEHAKGGDVAKAVEFFDRCLAADPAYVYAYYHKAKALLGDGRVDEARAVAMEGAKVARTARDGHAAAELSALLDEMEE